METDAWIETIFQLVYMKRWENDETTFESMLKAYEAEQDEALSIQEEN
jgi:hypothetical protein